MVIRSVGIVLVFMMLIFLINPVFAITQLERVEIINPHLENSFGAKISDKVNIDQQVQISAAIKNNQDKEQKFTYIVQIKNQYDIIVKVDWLSGSFNAKQTFSPSLSWTPQLSGIYTVEIYVWESLLAPDPLTKVATMNITV